MILAWLRLIYEIKHSWVSDAKKDHNDISHQISVYAKKKTKKPKNPEEREHCVLYESLITCI